METGSVNWSRVADTLESLRQELARLGERVAALEKVAGSGTLAPPAPAPVPAAEDVSEEIVLVISAAVAAFLGKKAPRCGGDARSCRLAASSDDEHEEQPTACVQPSTPHQSFRSPCRLRRWMVLCPRSWTARM